MGTIYGPTTHRGVKGSETGVKTAYSEHLGEVGRSLVNPGVKVGATGNYTGNSRRKPRNFRQAEEFRRGPGIVGAAPGIVGGIPGEPILAPTFV